MGKPLKRRRDSQGLRVGLWCDSVDVEEFGLGIGAKYSAEVVDIGGEVGTGDSADDVRGLGYLDAGLWWVFIVVVLCGVGGERSCGIVDVWRANRWFETNRWG